MKTIFALCLLAALPVYSQSEEAIEIDPLTAPAAKLGYTFQSNKDLDWNQGSLVTPLTPKFQLTESLSAGALFNYRVTSFKDLGSSERNGIFNRDGLGNPDVEDTYHSFGVPIYLHYDPRDSKWGVFGQLAPRLSSDLNQVDSNDIYYTGFTAITYDVSRCLTVNFGIGNSLALGDDDFKFFAGFSYTPFEELNISLSGSTLTASYSVNDRLIVRGGGYAGGGLWNQDLNGESFDLTLSSYNVGVGADYRLTENIWLSVWGGATIANRIGIQSSSGSLLDEEDMDTGAFGYIGLKAFEW